VSIASRRKRWKTLRAKYHAFYRADSPPSAAISRRRSRWFSRATRYRHCHRTRYITVQRPLQHVRSSEPAKNGPFGDRRESAPREESPRDLRCGDAEGSSSMHGRIRLIADISRMTKNDDDNDDDVPALFTRPRAREDALADANRSKVTARPLNANYAGVTERHSRGFMR